MLLIGAFEVMFLGETLLSYLMLGALRNSRRTLGYRRGMPRPPGSTYVL